MSSIPGLTMEDWLEWNYSIDRTASQFSKLVEKFEHKREYIETKLEDFDEEKQGWRSYNSAVFSDLTTPEFDMAITELLYNAPVEHKEELKQARPQLKPCNVCGTSFLFMQLKPDPEYAAESGNDVGFIGGLLPDKMPNKEFENGFSDASFFVSCECSDIRHSNPKQAIEQWNSRFKV
jgi:hypothetical protein